MSKRNQIVEVLDSCLRQIQQGELTIEDCLLRHPELADQLHPLLLAATAAMAQLAPDGPSPQFRSGSRARLLNLSRARRKKGRHQAAPRRRLRWRPAYALGSLLMALALLAGSVGVAYAAGEALPGDSLYGLKRGIERVALTISPTDDGDARLLLRHADRRVDELGQLLQSGRLDELQPALSGYRSAIDEILALNRTDPAQLDEVDRALSQHEAALQAAIERAPNPALPALMGALNHAQQGHQIVEQIRSGGRPSDLAPGQRKKSTGDDQETGDYPPGLLKKLGGQGGRVPPGLLKKQTGEPDASEAIPPGQLKKNACAPDDPGRGNPNANSCKDQ